MFESMLREERWLYFHDVVTILDEEILVVGPVIGRVRGFDIYFNTVDKKSIR